MKTLKVKMVALILGLGLITSGVAMAQGWGNGQRGFGMRGPIMTEDMRIEMYQSRYEVLAELSGKSVDEVKEESTKMPFYALLKKYDINAENFRDGMHEKSKEALKKAISSGKVSQEDGEAMLQWMETRKDRGFQRGPGQRGRGMGRFGGPCNGRGPQGQIPAK